MGYLFLFLVFCFPIQLGKHFWPSFSLLDGIRVDYLSPTLYFTDILTVLVIAVALVSPARKNIFSLSSTAIFVLLLELLSFSLSVTFSTNPLFGWYTILKFSEFFLLFLVARYLLSTEGMLKSLTRVFLLSLAGESLLALFQVDMQRSMGGIFWWLGERTFSSTTPGIALFSLNGQLLLRGYGTFAHPNVFAGYLLVGGILSWYNKERLTSLFRLFACSVVTVGLILTMSRFPLLLWVLFLFLQISSRKTKAFLLAGLSLMGFFVLLILFPSLRENKSLFLRWDYLIIGMQQIVSHPLLGVGFGNYISLSLPGDVGGGIPQPIHNIFLLLLSSTGISGFLFALFALWQSAKKVIGKIFPEMLLLAFVLLGNFDHYFITLQQGLLLTVLVFALIWRENKV